MGQTQQSATPGSKRYMPFVPKWGDHSKKCYFCVPDKRSEIFFITDEQIKNDLITGYSDLQGLGCKQAAYDNIAQRPEEPVRSYIVRYSRLFKLLNGTAPNEVRMRTTSMDFVKELSFQQGGEQASRNERKELLLGRHLCSGLTMRAQGNCIRETAQQKEHNYNKQHE